MKGLTKNIDYFFREIKTIVKLDLLSNLFSLLSLGFIFFLVSLIFAGGYITDSMIRDIENQAEISVYYEAEANKIAIGNQIEKIAGVKEVIYINKEEAKMNMTEILGEESRILDLFDHNPFDPYIEIRIDLNEVENITEKANSLSGVELVRNNKEILDKLKDISSLISLLGVLIIISVSVATLIVTSHIIRQGINLNKEQINTLRLLGAPEFFIRLPYILEGLIMTVLAGLISSALIYFTFNYIYVKVIDFLPFMILPSLDKLLISIFIFTALLAIILGFIGSIFGLKSTKTS
ncbi:MAG: hypothetical protein GX231_04860 [Tissierellia bacterium]|nr:hypothetical protein [Tissierellia bacterium]